MPQVSIVILNYNGASFLQKFLPSVLQFSNYEWAKVIVADNASTDNSVELLRQHFAQVKLIELKENTGYAGGYQAALAQVQSDYYVLLNSDIEVSENWLQPAITMMEQNPNVAAVQPKIIDYKNRNAFEYAGAAGGEMDLLGYPFCRGRIFDTLEDDNGQYNNNSPIFWASGACLFVRATDYWNAGGLDADFFAHQEEIDLCWRLQRLNREVWYCSNATIYHVGGGTLAYANPRKTFLNFRNNLWLLAKNLPASQLVWKLPLRLILDGVAALQLTVKHKSFADLVAILKAHFAFYGSVKSILRKRRNFNAPFTLPKTVYGKSILVKYFVLGKKKYTEL